MDGDFGHLTDDADDPVGTPCPTPADGVAVPAGEFWPAIEPAEVRAGARLQPNVTPERLRTAIVAAVMDVARELDGWRAERQLEGYNDLPSVPGRLEVDGKTDFEILWARAVTALVAADLGDRLRGMSATHAGQDRADALESEADDHRKMVRWAVRDFLGVPRVRATLL